MHGEISATRSYRNSALQVQITRHLIICIPLRDDLGPGEIGGISRETHPHCLWQGPMCATNLDDLDRLCKELRNICYWQTFRFFFCHTNESSFSRYPLLPQPAGNSSVGQPIGVAAERGTTIRTSPHVSSPKDLQSSGKTGSPRHGGCKDGCRVTQVPSPASQRQTERVVVKMASSEERYTNLPRVRVQPRQQHPARMRPTPPSNPGQEERVAHQASSSAASKPLSPSESVASCPDLSPSCPTGAGLGWQDPRMSLWALHQLFMAHNVSQSWTARALNGPPSSAAPPNGSISGVSALPGHNSGNPLETWHLQNLWYHGSLAHHLQTGRATGPVDSVVSQTGQCDVARRRTADHDQSLARQTQQTVARSSVWNVPSGMREDYGRI